ncbi:MAG TPA: transcriptional repressor [Actinomycetota bacterium]
MTEAARLVSSAGLRATRQRVAVIEALRGTERPVTAQALHRAVRRRAAGPGLATVYRTLNALSAAGLVESFPAGEEQAYRLCEPAHHHHLICERCGRVDSIPSCEVEGWAEDVASRRGFAVTGHRADVFGLCETCRRSR